MNLEKMPEREMKRFAEQKKPLGPFLQLNLPKTASSKLITSQIQGNNSNQF